LDDPAKEKLEVGAVGRLVFRIRRMDQMKSRRDLLKIIGTNPLLGMLEKMAFSQDPNATGDSQEFHSFPKGFLWGSATAAYQVEGAARDDGRGTSIWDTFSHTPGKTTNGDTGDVADDFYHRYPEDIKLMKAMGLRAFRFSVSWSRIMPAGIGPINQRGLDFYQQLVDTLLDAGIAPFCTLFHWDLPQTLEDKGGWRSQDTSKAFADYAGFIAAKLSGQVKHFMTMNEIGSFVGGYDGKRTAPGLQLGPSEVAQLKHNVLVAHGLGVQAIRARAQRGTAVGLADDLVAVTPVYGTRDHVAAARVAIREENAGILTAILEGNYTHNYIERLGSAAPKFTAEEMHVISSALDFIGLNIYRPAYVRASESPSGYENVPLPYGYPHMESSWLTIGPEAMFWVPKLVAEVWRPMSIYITENGASAVDTLLPDGTVLDIGRVMYLRNYLMHLQRAVREGVPLRGYFVWTFLDNFEWADGYGKRFGIHYVDFKTQERTPKLSAEFYREVIARNGLV
jgi:beta-glucosidase